MEPLYDYSISNQDVEDPENRGSLFNGETKYERIIKHDFIGKVFSIVASQVILNVLTVGIALLVPTVRLFFMIHQFEILLISSIISLVLIIYLVFCSGGGDTTIFNWFCLFIFTLAESALIAVACVFYDAEIVLQAFTACSIMVLGLVIFTLQTTYDFTSLISVAYFALLGLLTIGIIQLFFPYNNTFEMIFSIVSAMIFSLYLIIDVQRLIGRGKIKYESNQYILAALSIYLDVVNLFLDILRIIVASRR